VEIKQLKVFLEVCEHMNITQAAKSLNYSQSTISDTIQKLEEELQTPLFNRIKKRIYITDKGVSLQTYAKRLINLHDEALEHIKSDTLSITIGITESLCAYKFPSFFRDYLKTHPNVSFSFEIARCEDFIQLIESNQVDLAFTLDLPVIHPNITSELLFDEEIVLLQSSHFQDAIKTYDDLNMQNIIISKGLTGYNIDFYKIYERNKINHGSVTYMENIEGIKSYVRDGFGITFLPYTTVEEEIKNNILSPIYINDERYYHQVQLLTHTYKPHQEEVLNLMRQSIKTLKSSGN